MADYFYRIFPRTRRILASLSENIQIGPSGFSRRFENHDHATTACMKRPEQAAFRCLVWVLGTDKKNAILGTKCAG